MQILWAFSLGKFFQLVTRHFGNVSVKHEVDTAGSLSEGSEPNDRSLAPDVDTVTKQDVY